MKITPCILLAVVMFTPKVCDPAWGVDLIVEQIADLAPGVLNTSPNELTVVNDSLYFTAYDYGNCGQRGIWEYDGHHPPRCLGVQESGLMSYRNALYFGGDTIGPPGRGMYRYDGTGITLIDSNVQPSASHTGLVFRHPSHVFQDKLYFTTGNPSGALFMYNAENSGVGP